MDASILILLNIFLLCSAVPVPEMPEEDDCVCAPDENELIDDKTWEYFKSIDAKLDSYPVLAGELSPMLPCGNCLEYVRKKRKILPEVEDKIVERATVKPNRISEVVIYPTQSADAVPSYNKCPNGMRRSGIYCMPEDYDY